MCVTNIIDMSLVYDGFVHCHVISQQRRIKHVISLNNELRDSYKETNKIMAVDQIINVKKHVPMRMSEPDTPHAQSIE